MHLERMAAALVTGSIVMSSCGLACAQQTGRASVDSSGTQGNSVSFVPSISADGRFVAFASDASNLITGDTNGFEDIFVHDFQTGMTELVSVDSAGTQGNSGSGNGSSLSADGRFVAFDSFASNLVSGDANHSTDVFVHDRQTRTTERVSVNSAGAGGNDGSAGPSISADGRFVAFSSYASNLVSGDTNGWPDAFVRDRQSGTTERVSVTSAGAQANYGGTFPSISADGRFVEFESYASNLVSGDTNGRLDVFVHDRQTGSTERVSLSSSGTQGNSDSSDASISADGQWVAFDSYATNLVSGDTNGTTDVFVRDRQAKTTKRVSVDSAGSQGNDTSFSSSISTGGRFTAFQSSASNLVSGDNNGASDVFVHDLQTGITERVSVDSAGTEGNLDSVDAAISADGRFVAFHGDASNLVPGDTNGSVDVFFHGPYLTLEADPPAPTAGATLTFATWTGNPSGAALLVVIDINGAPVFLPAAGGTFDGTGLWTLAGTVPPGLGGTVVTFETLGIVSTGKADVSNSFAVSFQ